MTERGPHGRPARSTGDPEIDATISRLLDLAGATEDRDLLFELMATATDLAADDADRLDLKIATAALREMASAFEMFAPYRASPKITMFGSARTLPDDPLYVQARDLAEPWPPTGGWSSPGRARGSWPRAWRGPAASAPSG